MKLHFFLVTSNILIFEKTLTFDLFSKFIYLDKTHFQDLLERSQYEFSFYLNLYSKPSEMLYVFFFDS